LERFKSFASSLYRVNDGNFEDIALELFRFQAKHNPVYGSYLEHLRCKPADIRSINEIPFLPISFFKTHSVKTGEWMPETAYTSSGTTASTTSKHLVYDTSFYLSLSQRIFTDFFSDPTSFHFLALLPSYLERQGSSLIAMMDHFIRQSDSPHSGFYLNNEAELLQKLELLRKDSRKTILWGVSFALLDLAEAHEVDLSHCLIVETGGMKGRRKEVTREELHQFLCRRFNVPAISSEYGMTELMSQAYSLKNGYYSTPSWMKVLVRDINDPFLMVGKTKTGILNVIDLANFHSCAFIETQDLGLLSQQGYFEVLGRADNSDVRGCNLLVG